MLGKMWAGRPAERPLLIFPVNREVLGSARRVSEQESKILFTQWLDRNGLVHSVETPTRTTFRQTGVAELSARTDVTVYGSFSETDRILNIELKAGLQGGAAGLESFRKDLEKLLREGTDGLWFHTLTAAPRTWDTLVNTIHAALTILEVETDPDCAAKTAATEGAIHSIHFAFCVLESGTIEKEFVIDFRQDWKTQLVGELSFGTTLPVNEP